MTRKAAFKQADVARLVRGAISGGLPVGSFKISVDGSGVHLLPLGAPEDTAGDDLERRMQEAFGEDGDGPIALRR